MAGDAGTDGSVGGHPPASRAGRSDAPRIAAVHHRRVSLRVRVPSPSAGSFEADLPFPPLLESWERREHPSQVRLREYRDAIRALAAPALAALEPPLALGFHVAGRPDVAAGCDLDNILTPVVKALGGGEAFAFVWATRGRASDRAFLTITRATDVRLVSEGAPSHRPARLSVSPERPEWKAALAAAVGRHETARGRGRVELALRFGVAPERNWVTLWKPAIDALGGILGEGARPWHPRDDRISLLILQRELRPELAWDVELAVSWAVR